MSVNLKHFDGGTITAKDDAILYDFLIGESGILYGCDITYLGANKIKIGAGRGIVKGRIFTVEEEEIAVNFSNNGNQLGRIFLHMDLKNKDTPLIIKSITGTFLPELVKNENCNQELGIYEMELVDFIINEITIVNWQASFQKVRQEAAKSEIEAILNGTWEEKKSYEDEEKEEYSIASDEEIRNILGGLL